LRYLNNTLKNAVIVQPTSTDKVEIGSKVTVNDGKNTREFTIVGGHESDIMNGKLSCYSPIGKALMYRKVGDKVLVHIPAGEVVYTVISISL
jgi:transcription elongation factor GreA